jgi:hypothetical protein
MDNVTHILSAIEQGDPHAAEQLRPVGPAGDEVPAIFPIPVIILLSVTFSAGLQGQS